MYSITSFKQIRFQGYGFIRYPIGLYINENLESIRQMADAIKQLPYSRYSLCCRGSSGAIISGIIASLLLNLA